MIRIFNKEQQAKGAFNGGEIVENKPVGFPREGGVLRPYSNIFYWAHAKAVVDSTIGLHPHQGFEICSFVLKGEIRHFDTKLKEWIPLQAGDVQIIRAGNGISHSEFMGKGSEMFQIWFDPNLQKTLEKPASYADYRAEDFPVEITDTARITHLVGKDSPFKMDSPKVAMQRIELDSGVFTFPLEVGAIASIYVYEGAATLNEEDLAESAFALVSETKEVSLRCASKAVLFVMTSPSVAPYLTYAQQSFG